MENKPLEKFGYVTPKNQFDKYELKKLTHAFSVETGDSIYKGQPVMINADGTISPYDGTSKTYIGVAATDNITPCYGATKQHAIEVTVYLRGFAIIFGYAGADGMSAGVVKPTSTVSADWFVSYVADTTGERFIALTDTATTGDLMEILVL